MTHQRCLCTSDTKPNGASFRQGGHGLFHIARSFKGGWAAVLVDVADRYLIQDLGIFLSALPAQVSLYSRDSLPQGCKMAANDNRDYLLLYSCRRGKPLTKQGICLHIFYILQLYTAGWRSHSNLVIQSHKHCTTPHRFAGQEFGQSLAEQFLSRVPSMEAIQWYSTGWLVSSIRVTLVISLSHLWKWIRMNRQCIIFSWWSQNCALRLLTLLHDGSRFQTCVPRCWTASCDWA